MKASALWIPTSPCSLLMLLSGSWRADSTLLAARPAVEQRKFRSEAVDDFISTVVPRFTDPDLAVLFSNCLPNTLDTTVYHQNSTDTFIITGDIEAMWLRDSTNQVLPYMPFVKKDPALSQMLCGVIQRQAYSILLNPYANSFNFNHSGEGHMSDETTPKMTPGVFEAKYEIDSLAAFLKLSWSYWSATESNDCFVSTQWLLAVETVLSVVTTQQAGTLEELESSNGPAYKFQRNATVATDTLMQAGLGVTSKRCGLSKSYFRPSDDAVTLPFNVPGNMMMVVELRHVSDMLKALGQAALADDASTLADEIDVALQRHAVVVRDDVKIYTYEVDGFGSHYFMDDANIPSLLSIPYLGYAPASDRVYQATRRLLLSDANPFFFKGNISGIGGPHEGPRMVWPMALIVQAFTTDDDDEIAWILEALVQSSAGTGFLHEAFDVDNVEHFTRSWFAWVNGLFGELVMMLMDRKPGLVFKQPGRRMEHLMAR